MKRTILSILSLSLLMLGCNFNDSDLEDLKQQAAKEAPWEITVPTEGVYEAEHVPSKEPVTEEESTLYNQYFENLSPKRIAKVVYDGNNATVEGDVTFTVNGAHVTITTSKRTLITLQGTTSNGSLTILPSNPLDKEQQYRCGVQLNGVKLRNPNGAVVNSQLKKRLLVDLVPGTENVLESGAVSEVLPATEGKGCLFSEDKIIISSSDATIQKQGSLTITSAFQNCIAADDYLIIRPNTNIVLNAQKANGIKTKDGVFVWGGQTTVFCEGETKVNKVDKTPECPNGLDTVTCAGIKTDSLVHVKGGLLQVKCAGKDAKGIKCDWNYTQDAGKVYIVTLAEKHISSPKGVKAGHDFILDNGSFYSYSRYSDPLDVLGETRIKSANVRRRSYLIEVR